MPTSTKKLNQIDFAVITNICDYFGMTAIFIANNPTLRQHMYLDKVDKYAKPYAAVKANEQQASIHSKMVTAASSVSLDLNYVFSDKKN
jgi:hypothetical protein